MAQPVMKAPMKEKSNQPQGRSGSATPTRKGPATGRAKGNPTKGGGVTQATRGKFKS